jgi:cGMP-dependent 3',5'-cyclic phosphodiesterase
MSLYHKVESVFLQLLIYEEFFTQGDLEKAMGNRPIEMMDRDKACIPTLQLQFLDDIVMPAYE